MDRKTLQALHTKTGELITVCNRMLAAVISLGSLFCLMLMASMVLAQKPEQVFHIQAFMINYSEFAKAEAPSDVAVAAQKAGPLHKDPNWDGAVAGAGMGLTVGRNIPLIGGVAGPIIGALIGYRMDSKI